MEASLVYAPNLVYSVSPRSHRHPSRAYNYARFYIFFVGKPGDYP